MLFSFPSDRIKMRRKGWTPTKKVEVKKVFFFSSGRLSQLGHIKGKIQLSKHLQWEFIVG